MSIAVVKLGSSVVALESGELRLSVLARVCEDVAALHREGVDVVVVTSGAIARGMHLLEPSGAAQRDRRAAGCERARPGASLPHLRRPAARAGSPDRAGAAHVLRHERAHPLPQRAPHAADAARLARRTGDQRERHDDHGRDLVRRQRLPRRPGRRAAGRRPAAAADRGRGALHRQSATRPVRRRWSRRSRIQPSSAACRSATRSRRWARAACARRWSRPRWRPPRGSRR